MVNSRSREAGKLRLGCLFSLFLVASAIYVGFGVFQVRLRYYQIQDEVKTQAGFASVIDNETIRRRLVARSDSLGLPLGPRQWTIRRTFNPRQITIQAEYEDSVVIEFAVIRKVLRFTFRPGTVETF
ncbi:MAG TPA: hypothetical protein VNL98_09570 [Gemmatimonadales bacterium]|nr:hypothetical protein [Gemmatimonadales bacterium]